MAVRKVYGSLSCTGTLRVLASLYEHDLAFDFIPVDIAAREQTDGHFLPLSPFGEVPVFQDDELTLIESRAVMRFIAFAYPKKGEEHIFKEPLIQGVVATWIDVEDHQFNPPASKIINGLLFKSKTGCPLDTAEVAWAEQRLGEVLDIYEERLNGIQYLGGDKFTSADLSHTPILYFLIQTSFKTSIKARPRVWDWSERLLARQAWVRVVEMIMIIEADLAKRHTHTLKNGTML